MSVMDAWLSSKQSDEVRFLDGILTPIEAPASNWREIDTLVLSSNGKDTCLTNRRYWFDSNQDYLKQADPMKTKTGDAGRLERRLFCKQENGVRFPGAPLTGIETGPGRFGFQQGTVRNLVKRRSSNLRDSVGSTPTCATASI